MLYYYPRVFVLLSRIQYSKQSIQIFLNRTTLLSRIQFQNDSIQLFLNRTAHSFLSMYSRRTRGCYAGKKFSKYRVFVLEEYIESFLNFFPTAFPSNYHDNCPSNYKEYSIPCRGALSYRYFYGILAKIKLLIINYLCLCLFALPCPSINTPQEGHVRLRIK